MRLFNDKIPSRIIIIILVYIFASAVLMFIAFNRVIKTVDEDKTREALGRSLILIEDFLKEQDIRFNREKLSAYLKKISPIIDSRISIVDLDGGIFADTASDGDASDIHRYLPEIDSAIEKGSGEHIRRDRFSGRLYMHRAEKSGSIVIRISAPLYQGDIKTGGFLYFMLSYAGITLIMIAVLTLYLRKRYSEQIHTVLEFSREFARGGIEKRLLSYGDDELGSIQRSMNVMCDTMKARMDETELQQARLKATLENISDGIAVIGRDGRIVISNRAFAGCFGFTSEAPGKIYYEVIRSAGLNSRVEKALVSDSEDSFEGRLVGGRDFDISIKPIDDESGMNGIILVMRDITEKKKMEQLKSDLVGNMSHELKTPITILKGYLETIEQNLDDRNLSSGLVARAIENADRQNSLINDILKLHTLESGVDYDISKIDLEEIIDNCLNILSSKISLKGITVHKEFSAQGQVDANRFLAEEVFFNILDNAVSYNNDGGSIRIRSLSDSGRSVISIRDTGIGIPADSIDRIFERFYRVDKSRSRETGGTGLGLSIVKHACDILRWKVEAASDMSGTEFRITIL